MNFNPHKEKDNKKGPARYIIGWVRKVEMTLEV